VKEFKRYSGDELEKELFYRLNDCPLGWKYFYVFIDNKDQVGAGVVNKIVGEQYWFLQTSPHSGRIVGYKSTYDDDLQFLNKFFKGVNFGFRPIRLSEREKKKMAKSGRIVSSVLRKIEAAKRMPPSQAGEYNIIGPYPPFQLDDLGDVSPATRELWIKMQEDLKRFDESYMTYVA